MSSDIFASIGQETNSLIATATARPAGSGGGYAIAEAAAAAAAAGGGNGTDGATAAATGASYRLHLNPLKSNGTDLDQQLFEVGNERRIFRTETIAKYYCCCCCHRRFANINMLAILAAYFLVYWSICVYPRVIIK